MDIINDWLVIGYILLLFFNLKELDFVCLKLGDNIKFRFINENELEVGVFKDVNYNWKKWFI